MNQRQVTEHYNGVRGKQRNCLRPCESSRRVLKLLLHIVINYCVYTYVNNSYFACIKVIMVYGGDRWATPWTNMHNNSCNVILMIHGAAVVPHHIPSYSMCLVLTSLWLQTADSCVYKCQRVSSTFYVFVYL